MEVYGRFCGRTESWRKVQPSTSVNLLYIRGTTHQLSVYQRYLSSTSVNFPWGRWNFHQVFVRQQDLKSSSVNIPCSRRLLSTCVNFLCGCRTYRQLTVQPRDHSPTFHASEGPSINFPYVCWCSNNFRQLSVHPKDYPSNFCVSTEHCVIFSNHYVRPQGLPSTSVNFCTFLAPSVNIPCDHGSIYQLSSTLRASTGPSVNFCQLSLSPRDIPSTSVKFPWFWEINIFCIRGTFCQYLSTFCASTVPSINFRQLFMTPVDLPSAFLASAGPVYFPPLLGSSSSSTEIPIPNSWNILLLFLLFLLLSSSSSSAVMNFLELKENSSFILIPLITKAFKQFSIL